MPEDPLSKSSLQEEAAEIQNSYQSSNPKIPSLEEAVKGTSIQKPEDFSFKIDARQEITRGELAKSLVRLLTWTIVGFFLLMIIDRITFNLNKTDYDESNDKELITLIWTSLTGLVGTALGFYFGTRTATIEQRRDR